MNRRPICGWMASVFLINDRKQPSCRIVGKAAMVVMESECRGSRSRSFGWSGPAEFPPSLDFVRRRDSLRLNSILSSVVTSQLNGYLSLDYHCEGLELELQQQKAIMAGRLFGWPRAMRQSVTFSQARHYGSKSGTQEHARPINSLQLMSCQQGYQPSLRPHLPH